MSTPRSTLAVAATSLFAVGIVAAALGPLLPHLARRLGVPVEALGAVFPALFAGALATQVAGGWLAERAGLRRLVVAGIGVITAGVLAAAWSPSLPVLLAGAALVGLGLGALDIGANVLVAAVYPGQRAVQAVNLLHLAFGAGAVVAPVLASAAARRWGTPTPVLLLAAVLGLGAALAGPRLLLSAAAAHEEPGRARGGLYRAPALWALALLLFLYVGGEMGMGGWTTVYLGRTTALGEGTVALVVSGFWLALSGGRLAGAALGARLGAGALLALSAAGACLGAALMLAGGGSAPLTVAGALLVGFCYGPIFPTAVVMATERFPGAASRAVAVVISLSSVGGMVLPPLQGLLLERVSPAASVALVAAGACGMLAVVLSVRRLAPAVTPAAGEAA